MIIVRDVFHAKYGRGDELVALFQEFQGMMPHMHDHMRLFTDASGRFFQVVTETEFESLAAFEAFSRTEMAHAEFGAWFGRMMECTEGGSREFYNLIAPA